MQYNSVVTLTILQTPSKLFKSRYHISCHGCWCLVSWHLLTMTVMMILILTVLDISVLCLCLSSRCLIAATNISKLNFISQACKLLKSFKRTEKSAIPPFCTIVTWINSFNKAQRKRRYLVDHHNGFGVYFSGQIRHFLPWWNKNGLIY